MIRHASRGALIGLSALWCVLPSAACADDAPPIVLRAARLIDGTGTAVSTPGVIVIRGERIEAVGPSAAIPADAQVIDLGDRTLLPGLIDCHTHITQEFRGSYAENVLHAVKDTAADKSFDAAQFARITLAAGFTTIRNLGANERVDIALRDAIAAGKVPGPRVIASARPIGITGGHCDRNGLRPDLFPDDEAIRPNVGDGPDAIRRAVRQSIKDGADVIKVCATGGVLSRIDSLGAQQMTDAELTAAVEEAHRLERRIAAHAHGTDGIKAALRAGIDSIEHGSMLDDEAIILFKKTGAYLVPTLIAGESTFEQAEKGQLAPDVAAKARAVLPLMRASLAKAVKAGVKIAFGTDAGVFKHGENAREFVYLVRGGMSPLQAIQAATLNAATLLGRDKDLGTLAAGKFADVIAVSGDPSSDVTTLQHVDFVMKGGAVFKQPAQ
jgi:imidazolonepropionase-like amidohydrolase